MSVSVSPEMLQKMPISRLFWVRRRTICTQRNSSRLSTTLIRPAWPATCIYCAGMITWPFSSRRRDKRFVIAQLALRQADDRLQVKIDAVLFQAGADDLEQFVLVAEGADIGRRRAALRARRLVRHGARASGNLAGEIAHQGFEHFQLGDDLLFLGAGLLLHQSAQFGQTAAGLVQRGFEFQMSLAQMRHLAGDGALVAAPGEGRHDLLDEDEADEPCEDRNRPPVKRARPAPKVAQTKNTLRVSRNRVTLEMCSLMRRSWARPVSNSLTVKIPLPRKNTG